MGGGGALLPTASRKPCAGDDYGRQHAMSRTNTPDQKSLALRKALFLTAAALQVGCGLVFVGDVIAEFGDMSSHTWVEAFGVLALAVGATLTFREYRSLLARNSKVERELGAASGALQEAIEAHFDAWGLTAAERDVALLSIKGVPIADIATMRNTREGTIKAQSAAIYRKAGVSGRAELISLVIEELLRGLDSGAP